MAGSRRLTPEALAIFCREFGIEHHKDSLQDLADTEGAAFLSDLFAELDCGEGAESPFFNSVKRLERRRVADVTRREEVVGRIRKELAGGAEASLKAEGGV